MTDSIDIYTLIFLGLAVFIFFRLRSVLGQRTGHERPPQDGNIPANAYERADEKIITLPNRSESIARQEAAAPQNRWKPHAEPGTPLAVSLDAILAKDASFNLDHFITGAKTAYEMIVCTFAQGDRQTLRPLLSADVFEGFDSAIKDRESRGETVDTKFISIDKATPISAELRENTAFITLRFVSQIITTTKNKAGERINENNDQIEDVTDIWTFAKDLSARDPNWKLVATESEE